MITLKNSTKLQTLYVSLHKNIVYQAFPVRKLIVFFMVFELNS